MINIRGENWKREKMEFIEKYIKIEILNFFYFYYPRRQNAQICLPSSLQKQSKMFATKNTQETANAPAPGRKTIYSHQLETLFGRTDGNICKHLSDRQCLNLSNFAFENGQWTLTIQVLNTNDKVVEILLLSTSPLDIPEQNVIHFETLLYLAEKQESPMFTLETMCTECKEKSELSISSWKLRGEKDKVQNLVQTEDGLKYKGEFYRCVCKSCEAKNIKNDKNNHLFNNVILGFSLCKAADEAFKEHIKTVVEAPAVVEQFVPAVVEAPKTVLVNTFCVFDERCCCHKTGKSDTLTFPRSKFDEKSRLLIESGKKAAVICDLCLEGVTDVKRPECQGAFYSNWKKAISTLAEAINDMYIDNRQFSRGLQEELAFEANEKLSDLESMKVEKPVFTHSIQFISGPDENPEDLFRKGKCVLTKDSSTITWNTTYEQGDASYARTFPVLDGIYDPDFTQKDQKEEYDNFFCYPESRCEDCHAPPGDCECGC
jgi:hypothetical protein